MGTVMTGDVLIGGLVVVFAYLLGSVPSGLWIGLVFFGKDVRNYGSGKTGATNVLRTFGKPAMVAVVVVDTLKSVVAVGLARYLLPDAPVVHCAAATAAVIGHTWPVFARFRGGRGVLVAASSFLILDWQVYIVALTVFVAVGWRWRYVSLSSLVSAFDVPGLLLLQWLITPDYPLPYVGYGVLAGGFVIVTHHDNIRRLIAGTEAKLGQGGVLRTTT